MDTPTPERISIAAVDVGAFEALPPPTQLNVNVAEHIHVADDVQGEVRGVNIQAIAKEVGLNVVPITQVRRELAIGLVAVLALAILGSFLLLIYIATGLDAAARWTAEKEWMTVIFGPLVTLVATVLGYYFGSKSGGAE